MTMTWHNHSTQDLNTSLRRPSRIPKSDPRQVQIPNTTNSSASSAPPYIHIYIYVYIYIRTHMYKYIITTPLHTGSRLGPSASTRTPRACQRPVSLSRETRIYNIFIYNIFIYNIFIYNIFIHMYKCVSTIWCKHFVQYVIHVYTCVCIHTLTTRACHEPCCALYI